MSTNFYLTTGKQDECTCCGQKKPQFLHIGKSSGGWVFHLHSIPELGLTSLTEWKKAWHAEGALIEDEYGKHVSQEEMEKWIQDRSMGGGRQLLRLHLDRPGGPTWDMVEGEFS